MRDFHAFSSKTAGNRSCRTLLYFCPSALIHNAYKKMVLGFFKMLESSKKINCLKVDFFKLYKTKYCIICTDCKLPLLRDLTTSYYQRAWHFELVANNILSSLLHFQFSSENMFQKRKT